MIPDRARGLIARRDAEYQSGGQWPEGSLRPHRGGRTARRNEGVIDPELFAKLDGFGPPRQEGVGAKVHLPAPHVGRPQVAAEARRGFEHHYPRAGRCRRRKLPCGRQAGYPAAYDGDGGAIGIASAGMAGVHGDSPAASSTTFARISPRRGSPSSDGVRT